MHFSYPTARQMQRLSTLHSEQQQKLLSLLDSTFPNHTSGCLSESREQLGGFRLKISARVQTAFGLMRVHPVQTRLGAGKGIDREN